jgi:hypothetical protein
MLRGVFHGRKQTKYLPPPGAYYDQFDIKHVFSEAAFSADSCSHCLDPDCTAIYPGECDNFCEVYRHRDTHLSIVSHNLIIFST